MKPFVSMGFIDFKNVRLEAKLENAKSPGNQGSKQLPRAEHAGTLPTGQIRRNHPAISCVSS
jgi:hypothetical protein